MAYRLFLLAAVLCMGGMLPGCTVCQLARVVSLEEPGLFDSKKDREISLATYRGLADEAWASTGACCPDDCASEDYVWGFREGFSEFVYAGGSGEPPVLPPRSYWQSDNRTTEGAMAVRSWFQGYRYGVQVACEGGYRQSATVVVSASVRDSDSCGKPDGCGKVNSDSCDSDNCDASTTFELDGPALQQPELEQLEMPLPIPMEEPTPEVILPAPETAPAPPVPSVDRSTKEESNSSNIFDNDYLGTDAWKAKEPFSSAPKRPSPSTRAENIPTQWAPTQKNPVTQAFFPIVR